MSLTTFGKYGLTKLTILAYTDKDRSALAGTFKAMFNPESLATKYSTKYAKPQGIGRSAQELKYTNNPPEEMKLKLILNKNQYGSSLLNNKIDSSVKLQIQKFLDLTWRPFGDIHQPLFLKVVWGGVVFPCRLNSVDIKYTLFDRVGEPTAAELDIALKGDLSKERENLVDNFSSPDLTHMRIVKSGDTLPLLCQQIYGDSSYYPTVAQANALDNFRNLQIGQKLYFPPLT